MVTMSFGRDHHPGSGQNRRETSKLRRAGVRRTVREWSCQSPHDVTCFASAVGAAAIPTQSLPTSTLVKSNSLIPASSRPNCPPSHNSQRLSSSRRRKNARSDELLPLSSGAIHRLRSAYTAPSRAFKENSIARNYRAGQYPAPRRSIAQNPSDHNKSMPRFPPRIRPFRRQTRIAIASTAIASYPDSAALLRRRRSPNVRGDRSLPTPDKSSYF